MTDKFSTIHDRWILDIHSKTGVPGYKDEWYWQQCADCRHWLRLAGPTGDDWGVCANPRSAFDGRVRFEHDRCEFFESRADSPE